MKEYRLGLLAKDIHNSVTPKVYAHYAKDLGVKIDYQIFNIPPEELSEQLEYCRKELCGFNVTMPYKQKVLEFVDEVDESAEKCGSTNTVLVRDNRLIAYNTDGWGLMKAFELKGVSVRDKKVVMLGAGGVGLSIAYNLSINAVGEVKVVNIFLDQAQDLCERFDARFYPIAFTDTTLEESCRGADIFINASIMGQVGYDDFKGLNFLTGLKRDGVVYDVNYSNPAAKLVPAAQKAGLQAYIGHSLTACQGVRAMEIWTGMTPSDTSARELVEALESKV